MHTSHWGYQSKMAQMKPLSISAFIRFCPHYRCTKENSGAVQGSEMVPYNPVRLTYPI